MPTIRQQIKEFKVGAWVKVYWPDPSASPVEDGSAEQLVEGHSDPEYGTLGHYLGIKTIKGRQTFILANDERVDNEEEEYRGTLTVPVKLIYKIEERLKRCNSCAFYLQGRKNCMPFCNSKQSNCPEHPNENFGCVYWKEKTDG